MDKSVVYATLENNMYRLEIYSDYDDSYQGEYLVDQCEFSAYKQNPQYIIKYRNNYNFTYNT